MNTYSKFCPNVFLAKCQEHHQKGEEILLTTKHGKEYACIVFNLIFEKDGFFYYSIVRADGFDFQKHAAAKAAKLQGFSENAEKRSEQYYQASQEGKDFLSLGEPIHVGHHSEKRHRALFERNHNRMRHSIEEDKKAEDYKNRAAYWEKKAHLINLSMPESLEFYEFELEKARAEHTGLKNGTIARAHSYSLIYASKKVYELEKKLMVARKLWA